MKPSFASGGCIPNGGVSRELHQFMLSRFRQSQDTGAVLVLRQSFPHRASWFKDGHCVKCFLAVVFRSDTELYQCLASLLKTY
jgi:hypothetical protein